MARIQGVDKKHAGLVTRIAYWMVRRKVGRVIEPIRITAHQPRLLRALDRKSTRLNSSHIQKSRMPSSA